MSGVPWWPNPLVHPDVKAAALVDPHPPDVHKFAPEPTAETHKAGKVDSSSRISQKILTLDGFQADGFDPGLWRKSGELNRQDAKRRQEDAERKRA